MKKKVNYIALLILVIIASCQTNEKPKGFDYGKVENNIYKNSFFDFNITLPSDWVVQTKEQNDDLVEMGKDLVAGNDENLKTAIEASEINSAYLLTVFKHKVGTAVKYNPSLMLVAENLKLAPGIKTGGDYLFQTKKFLKQSQVKYNHIDQEFKKVNLDNQEFYKMNLDLNHMDFSIKQSYYSTIKKGFSINAIISYATDEQKDELEKMLNSLKFNK